MKKNINKRDSHPQLETGGAWSLHASGRVRALVTFNTTPN